MFTTLQFALGAALRHVVPPNVEPDLLNNGSSDYRGLRDERAELLYRVASSSTFKKSNRLRELLLYLGERKLSDSECFIREQEIWVEVFGRRADLNASEDTLVRVHASQLRKKLQQYFSEEGKDEPIIIELPKGGYTPVFRPRNPAPGAVEQPRREHRGMLVLAGIIGGALVLVIALLLWQNAALRHRADLSRGDRSSVNALWRQLFENGQQTDLVLADGNLVVFENDIGEQISLQDYQTAQFEKLATERIPDPKIRNLSLGLLGRPYTGTADAKVAFNMSLIFASNQLRVDLVFARNLTTAQVSSNNTILLGSERSNPWVGLFEDKLNFRTVFTEENDHSHREVQFVNMSPRPGEKSSYLAGWGRNGYCRVAYLPNSAGTGSTLIISGTEVQMTEAGGEFITSEHWVEQLRNSLGLAPNAPMPPFEVLLDGEIITGSVANFHIVAWRRLGSNP